MRLVAGGTLFLPLLIVLVRYGFYTLADSMEHLVVLGKLLELFPRRVPAVARSG